MRPNMNKEGNRPLEDEGKGNNVSDSPGAKAGGIIQGSEEHPISREGADSTGIENAAGNKVRRENQDNPSGKGTPPS